MPQRSRIVELWLIAAVFSVVSSTFWLAGRLFDEPLLSFTGLMTLASTFVPMPADAYVVHASRNIDPVVIGLLGGAINAVAVLGERAFLLRMIEYPAFDRLKAFVGTNRFVDAVERRFFVGLMLAAASPLPFEVFRFLAVTREYDRWRYALATFFGRGARYYGLAVAGGLLADDQVRAAVVLLVALFAVGVVRSLYQLRSSESVTS